MFEKDLEKRLIEIFGIKTVRFQEASDEHEQDVMFIEIKKANSRVSRAAGGVELCKVEGKITIFTQDLRMPFGFFNKKLELAEAAVKAPLTIFDEANGDEVQNLNQRTVDFLFLYKNQYDPSQGSITSVEFDL